MRKLASLLFALLVTATAARASQFDDAIAMLITRPIVAGQTELAAHLETEGHWQFANRAAERFTASGPQELLRAIKTLAPQAESPGHKLVITLTSTALFSTTKSLEDLPESAVLRAYVDDNGYPIQLRTKAAPLLQVTPSMSLVASDWQSVSGALWHLNRTLPRNVMRVIGLEPGGPALMSSSPRIDPQTKQTLVDQLDPSALVTGLAGARGQFVVVKGRRRDDTISIRSSGAKEATLSFRELAATAAGFDIGLIFLDTSSPAQPGGRNWLWTPYDLQDVHKAGSEAARLVDVLSLIAGNRRLVVQAGVSDGRVLLEAKTDAQQGQSTASRWLRSMSDAVTDLLGTTPAETITISLPSVARQKDLDRRVLRFLPFWTPWSYAALLMLGLLGWPTAQRWFVKVWPPEAIADYGNRAGWYAACAVRGAVFAFVFVPLAAIAAAPVQIMRRLVPSYAVTASRAETTRAPPGGSS